MEKRFSAVDAKDARRTQNFLRALRAILPRALCASTATTALSLVLVLTLTGCGTKTELLRPDGKPNPAGTKDPSQPPSPISR